MSRWDHWITTHEMQIFIRWKNNKNSTLNDVEKTHTIHEIKEMITAKENIPPDQIRLLFAGKQLEGNRTLDYYDIQKESTLHGILRLGAGEFNFAYTWDL